MRRIVCTSRPAYFGCSDIELTPGKFYDLISIDSVDGRPFFTVKGDSGIEVQRPSDYFRSPESSDGKKLILKRAKLLLKS